MKGSVLIVGGGIAGIQAALDIAESGFFVHLVDKEPSVGGLMVKLDKTFPTGDCAMCTIAPRLVELARHPNIELLTYCELEEVKGRAGNFKVKIKKKASYVDYKRCTGCGLCENECPVETIDPFNEGLKRKGAIYKPYPQAIPNLFTIQKDGIPPCRAECPAGVNVCGYIQLLKKGKYEEAIKLIKEKNPFLILCAYVCHHPCEEACLRATLDESISIKGLKRFLADWWRKEEKRGPFTLPKENGRGVAVVGAGPAGLACAYFLRKEGYRVQIFEKEENPGGTPLYLIPSYRMPKDLVLWEIEEILSLGVSVRCKVEIDEERLYELSKEYDAVVVATGALVPRTLSIEGMEGEGVYLSLPFLRNVKLGKFPTLFSKVVVIGGGNVAIDCARTAIRLGKEVELFCLEGRGGMPAHPWEIEEAEREGVKINGGWGPQKLIRTHSGVIKAIEFKRVKRLFDEEGRFSPTFTNESKEVECKTVIVAIGQAGDSSILGKTPTTLHFRDNIFVAGDLLNGPSSVVEVVSSARKASTLINQYLDGTSLEEESPKVVKEIKMWDKRKERLRERKVSLSERKGFCLVELSPTEEEVREEAIRCLSCATCCECMVCEGICDAKAIVHGMKEGSIELEVGAIISAQGFLTQDEISASLGYGRFQDVLRGIELERLLSPSGPTGGELLCPSNKKEPSRIAFIQCIGSRDQGENSFCSSVCCAYAVKQALIAKEHIKTPLDITIFYMDMRMHGKGFEAYYKRAKEEGVRFTRARPSHIEEGNGALLLHYTREDGKRDKEEFCMVILSVGMKPNHSISKMLKTKKQEPIIPLKTEKEGIYLCSTWPKDIPDAVVDGSAASALVSSLLHRVRGTCTKEKVYPPQRDVSWEEVRVGVFVCNCGINIGGYVDVPYLVEEIKRYPGVVYVEENLYTCSQDTQVRIVEKIKEYGLNRVVVASCTPRTHEPLFQETLMEGGLNPYLFEMANIRDQCSWVHMQEREEATQKALSLIRGAIAKVKLLKAFEEERIPIIKEVGVIGGGLSGMISALNLAKSGFKVHLLEKRGELGGLSKRLSSTLEETDVKGYIEEIEKEVRSNGSIKVYNNVEIKEVLGYVGNFSIKPDNGSLSVGAIIVATGVREYKPTQYLYGKSKRVITQLEFEETRERLKGAKRVCMIQCVGARSEGIQYCGRVCCAQAIKNALWLKENIEDLELYILYRDIRTYEFLERYYTRAREAGIVFIRYEEDSPPSVEEKDLLKITVDDPLLGRPLSIEVDWLILSVPPLALVENEVFSQLLKVPLDSTNFFLEAHVKLRPVEFQRDGIYLCGGAHSPRRLKEVALQALAASAKVQTLLSKDFLKVKGRVARVLDLEFCRGCKKCEEICHMGAISFVSVDGRELSSINPALCKGCGACAGVCQSGAINPEGFETKTIMAQVSSLV